MEDVSVKFAKIMQEKIKELVRHFLILRANRRTYGHHMTTKFSRLDARVYHIFLDKEAPQELRYEMEANKRG